MARGLIRYRLSFDDGNTLDFTLEPARFEQADMPDDERPHWTELGYHQCTHCPLSTDEVSHCPAALALADVLPEFSDHISYDSVNVEVETDERTYSRRCDIQTALASIIGLEMATSPCPILGELRSMATFHLPFSTIEETVVRTVGIYLIKQHFAWQDGEDPDIELEGLRALYDRLETLNFCFAKRVRAAAEEDANLNAVVLLATLSALVTSSLDSQLERVRHRFEDPEDVSW